MTAVDTLLWIALRLAMAVALVAGIVFSAAGTVALIAAEWQRWRELRRSQARRVRW